jgi:hypothetical protein
MCAGQYFIDHNPPSKKINHRAHRGFLCVLKKLEKKAEKIFFTQKCTEMGTNLLF